MTSLLNELKNVNIINVNQHITSPSEYSKLLLDKSFWNIFSEKYLLIHQEDSIIFNFNIRKFINKDIDYIGAKWNGPQSTSCIPVGNGGFSLRNKEKMIQCLDYYKDDLAYNITFLELANNSINYIKGTKSSVVPEDLFFSFILQKKKIGIVADVNTANLFSKEQFLTNSNNFGGHNWWLATHRRLKLSHDFNLDFFNIFKTMILETPFELRLGGGENYLLNIVNYLLNQKKTHFACLFIPNYTDIKNITLMLDKIINNTETINRIKIFPRKLLYSENFKKHLKCDIYFSMRNSSIPDFTGFATKINIFHCQFPFDSNNDKEYSIKKKKRICKILDSYQYIFLNSNYSKNSYKNLLIKRGINLSKNKVQIIYPFVPITTSLSNKLDKTFILIGRMFPFHSKSNYKGITECIKIFNEFPDFTLHIVGGLKPNHIKYYNTLIDIKKKNIHLYPNAPNKVKEKLLSTSKYIVNMAGINCNYDFNYEHFGIAIIEGINFGCIPISINRGYPSYYIPKSNLFKNTNDLYALLNKLSNNSIHLEKLEPQTIYDKNAYKNRLDQIFRENN